MGRSQSDRIKYNAADIKTEWGSVLSPDLQARVLRYLTQTTSKPIQLVGGPGSIYSFREYATKMNVEFPTDMSVYRLTDGEILEGMDFKDVWLSKGPPVAVFLADGFITWRFKNDELAVFVDGTTVRVSR